MVLYGLLCQGPRIEDGSASASLPWTQCHCMWSPQGPEGGGQRGLVLCLQLWTQAYGAHGPPGWACEVRTRVEARVGDHYTTDNGQHPVTAETEPGARPKVPTYQPTGPSQ